MTDENPKPNTAITSQSPVVQGGAPVEIQALEHLFKGIVEPIVRGQEKTEVEKTKRVEIEASTTRVFFKYAFSLVVIILGISAFALYLEKDQLTEKIILAVISFVGGFAFGKGATNLKP